MSATLEVHGYEKVSGLSQSVDITVPNVSGRVMWLSWRMRSDHSVNSIDYGGSTPTQMYNGTGFAIRFLHYRLFDPPVGTNTLSYVANDGPYSDRQDMMWAVFSGIDKNSEAYGTGNGASDGRYFSYSKSPPSGGLFYMTSCERRNDQWTWPQVDSGTQIDRFTTGDPYFEGACINCYVLGDGTSKTLTIDHNYDLDFGDIWVTYDPLESLLSNIQSIMMGANF